MTIQELISQTKKNVDQIKQQHKIIVDFQKQNPWRIQSILEEIRQQQTHPEKQTPTFDSVLRFNNEFLVDDLVKIYRQVKDKKGKIAPVYFYQIHQKFYQKQLDKGYELGSIDDMGYLVTGSNLVIEKSRVEKQDFLDHYYTLFN